MRLFLFCPLIQHCVFTSGQKVGWREILPKLTILVEVTTFNLTPYLSRCVFFDLRFGE